MGKNKKNMNKFDELFGSMEHCRFWSQINVSMGNLNPDGLLDTKENA